MHFLEEKNKTKIKTLADFDAVLLLKNKNHFQAIYKEQVIAELFLDKESTSNVKKIIVKTGMRGKGLGNALISAVEEYTQKAIKPGKVMNYDGYRMWLRRNPQSVSNSLFAYYKQIMSAKNTGCQILEVTYGEVVVEKSGVILYLTERDLRELKWIKD